jgi:hypothetical protein
MTKKKRKYTKRDLSFWCKRQKGDKGLPKAARLATDLEINSVLTSKDLGVYRAARQYQDLLDTLDKAAPTPADWKKWAKAQGCNAAALRFIDELKGQVAHLEKHSVPQLQKERDEYKALYNKALNDLINQQGKINRLKGVVAAYLEGKL